LITLQENYLKTQPSRLRNIDGPEKALKELQLMDRAAASISDGDLVDALIHGFVGYLFCSGGDNHRSALMQIYTGLNNIGD